MITLEEALDRHSRPALCLIEKPFETGARCFSGGAPTLPERMAWPTDSRGIPCIFLAQFDLSALPFRPEGWPNAGTLFVFLASVIDDLYLVETAEPFLYYAGPEAVLREQWRPTPLAEDVFFQYAWGRDRFKCPKPMHDTFGLPKRALSFVPFEDVHVRDVDMGLLSDDEVQTLPKEQFAERGYEAVSALPDEERARYYDLRKTLGEIHSERRRAAFRKGHGLPEELADYGPSYSTKSVIDPGLVLWKTQFNTDRDSTKLPALACHETFPSTHEMIYRHAMRLHDEICGSYSTPSPPTSDGRRIAKEALSWAERARQMSETDVSDADRADYLAWCRAVYKRCLEVYAPRYLDDPILGEPLPFWARLIRWALPRSRLLRREQEKMLCHGLLDKISALHDICLDTFAAMDPVRFSSLSAEDQTLLVPDYVTNTTPQMFGFGWEIQQEVSMFQDHTLVYSTFGSEHIHLGAGTFCIWLAETDLVPNAWQRVIVASPAL
jgi:hypothetical protein